MQKSVEQNLKEFENLLEKCTPVVTQIRTTPKPCRSCTK